MRIDTQLTDDERDAIKEYAVTHGYTMKRAYTQLLRDALHDRFLMRIHPETGNIGVKYAGYENSTMANVNTATLMDRLEHYDGEWTCVFSPRWHALESAGIDVEREPTFWIDGDDIRQPDLDELDNEN